MFEKMIADKNNLVMALVLAVILASAPVCMARNYVLLIEQTPIEGGIVTPGTGVHSFAPGQTVTLTATPRAGYQFIRWMGDVSVTDASTTTVTLDGPKMLVAVFERVEYPVLAPAADDLGDQEAFGGGGAGGGGGRMTRQSSFIGGGGASPSGSPLFEQASVSPLPPPDDNDDETPGDPDIPVPVPEPGTITILAFGAGIVLVRRKS